MAAGAIAAIRHLKNSELERSTLRNRVAKVKAALDKAGIPHMDNNSHIIPVMVGDAHKCKWISDYLLDHHGLYIQPINYPTVARGTERLAFYRNTKGRLGPGASAALARGNRRPSARR